MERVHFSELVQNSRNYQNHRDDPDSVAEESLTFIGKGIWGGDRTVLVFPAEVHER